MFICGAEWFRNVCPLLTHCESKQEEKEMCVCVCVCVCVCGLWCVGDWKGVIWSDTFWNKSKGTSEMEFVKYGYCTYFIDM